MSINSGHARYFPRPIRTTANPLERAILQLEKMIGAQRTSALPAPFALYKAKRILNDATRGARCRNLRVTACRTWNKRSDIGSTGPKQ